MTVLEALIKGQQNNDRESLVLINRHLEELDNYFSKVVEGYRKERETLELRKHRIEACLAAGDNYKAWLQERA